MTEYPLLPAKKLAAAILGFGLIALVVLITSGNSFADLFSTPDRRGARAFAGDTFAEAAEQFADPVWRGVAHFRAGDFKQASIDFAARDDAITTFNRGNAQVMLGEYEKAIQSYDRALFHRADWTPAVANRELARLRHAKMQGPKDDAGGTGGKLGADEIVFDNTAKGSSEEEIQVGEGESLSDEETQALWLRRVQTKPADFLRAKFAFQHQEREAKKDGK